MAAKDLTNKKAIIQDINDNVAPQFFDSSVTKNAVSTYGFIVSVLGDSIADTNFTGVARSLNAIPELSDDYEKISMSCRLGGLPVNNATPSESLFMINVKITDIMERGTMDNAGDVTFVIDKRSEILHNNINFSLKYDVKIKAIRSIKDNKYIYTCDYQGEDISNAAYINSYPYRDADGIDYIRIIVTLYQFRYNTIQKTITDEIQFSTDGISFEYSDKLYDFDVYYKTGSSSDFIKAKKLYYLSEDSTVGTLKYSTDKINTDKKVVIYNTAGLMLKNNAELKIEIKETLGADGVIDIGTGETTFELYKDADYSYVGVDITSTMLDASSNGADGDTLSTLRSKLISAKFTRDNITTDLDIKKYINPDDANLQIITKRNDIFARLKNVYTLLKINNLVAPTNTFNLKMYDADFDISQNGRKVIRSNNKFGLLQTDVNKKTAVKINPTDPEIPGLEVDKTKLCLNMPFMMVINSDPIATLYSNTINTRFLAEYSYINDTYAYQFIARDVLIKRNPMDAVNYNKYNIQTSLIPNTTDDIGITDINGVLDQTKLKVFAVLYSGTTPKGYVPLPMTAYDKEKNIINIAGSFTTDDYITEDQKINITDGMYQANTTNILANVIDFKDLKIDLVVFYKDTPLSTAKDMYTIIPGMSEYTITNIYNNNNATNILIELNKFMNCSVKVSQEKQPDNSYKTVYSFTEVPFIKYSYAKTNIFEIATEIEAIKTKYCALISLCSGFTINLKFIKTYGMSSNILVGTNKTALNNLNPVLKFNVYGRNINKTELTQYILSKFEELNSIDAKFIFISNINTGIESKFNIKSIEYVGIDSFNSSYQLIQYIPADKTTKEALMAYIPEYLNPANIEINVIEA